MIKPKRLQGFTLIEVMVALVVIAIALGAAVRATGQLAEQQQRLHFQQLASMCADNAFLQMRLDTGLPPTSERAISCTQDGVSFTGKLSVFATQNQNFRRVQTSWLDPNGEPLITLTALASQ